MRRECRPLCIVDTIQRLQEFRLGLSCAGVAHFPEMFCKLSVLSHVVRDISCDMHAAVEDVYSVTKRESDRFALSIMSVAHEDCDRWEMPCNE